MQSLTLALPTSRGKNVTPKTKAGDGLRQQTKSGDVLRQLWSESEQRMVAKQSATQPATGNHALAAMNRSTVPYAYD